MSIMFYPKMSINIPASKPHPDGTEYRISIGEEDWEGVYPIVVKVQMVYNGKIAGRKSPSYPIGTDDSQRVAEAVATIQKQYEESNMKPQMVTIRPKPATYVTVEQFLAIICSIPEGYLTRWEDIKAYLKKIHNAQRIELESGSHWPDNVGNEKVPYWRIVGAYGYISDEKKIISREQCIKHLQSE